jgi:hypothetical protein
MIRSIQVGAACLIFFLAPVAPGQVQGNGAPSQPPARAPVQDNSASSPPPARVSKRIFGIIPNYRTATRQGEYQPLSTGAKFKIAAQDSFDPGSFILTGLIAGEAQLAHSTPAFGQEASGYARYYGATYGNLVIGSFMREAFYPSLLHQDPRYFRRGTGSAMSRVGYAMSQIFWTHNDSGRSQFNFSEILGSATTGVISDAYYPGRRTVGNAASKLGVQLGVGAFGNLLKEFWPLTHKPLHKSGGSQGAAGE